MTASINPSNVWDVQLRNFAILSFPIWTALDRTSSDIPHSFNYLIFEILSQQVNPE